MNKIKLLTLAATAFLVAGCSSQSKQSYMVEAESFSTKEDGL